jgi:beta-lactamase regulating signal transducer with metallopeptidase domain
MDVLIAIALKSLVIAGATLGLLALFRRRSASERSWIAHIGLLALVVLAFAPLVLPSWTVEVPALLGQVSEPAPAITSAPAASAPAIVTPVTAAPVSQALPPVRVPNVRLSSVAIATAAYAVPAAILLFITLLALGRLIALRARADVLVDGHWLSALARAQRRMGFKHGTALLTSDELASPISWGLMRPVILLNNRAVEAAGEAEAIIAHELAHVARLDWIKLLLARVATALFWFNPLVWALAREAHQLREEAADDAVLAANITDTDYAQLLVGVARHECPGLLLGAHGVAPSKSSLARRVARVLDAGSARTPAARTFALGVFVGAVLVAAPLTALTLAPGGTRQAAVASKGSGKATTISASQPSNVPADLPHIIARGVSTSVSTAVAAVAPSQIEIDRKDREEAIADALDAAREARRDALDETRDARERAVDRARNQAPDTIDDIIEMKAVGVTPDYVNQMRAAAPYLRVVKPSRFADLKAVGVTPDFARDLAAAGFTNLTISELQSARAVGITGDYARGMAAAGVPPNLGDYIQLRAVGVPVRYVLEVRKSGHMPKADKIVEMYAGGVQPGDLRVIPAPPAVPATPVPPRVRVKVKTPKAEVNVDPGPDPGDG